MVTRASAMEWARAIEISVIPTPSHGPVTPMRKDLELLAVSVAGGETEAMLYAAAALCGLVTAGAGAALAHFIRRRAA